MTTDTQDNEIAGVPINSTSTQLAIDDGSSAATFRNYLSNYFLSPRVSLLWQWKYTAPEIGNTL